MGMCLLSLYLYNYLQITHLFFRVSYLIHGHLSSFLLCDLIVNFFARASRVATKSVREDQFFFFAYSLSRLW